MENIKKIIIPILLVGVWINISETIRWLLIIESYWIEYYKDLNLIFPTGIGSGIIWIIWGFILASIIFVLSKKYTLLQTIFISWFAVFVMIWIVLWNIDILPVDLLWYNVPLSLLEVYIAALISKKFIQKSSNS